MIEIRVYAHGIAKKKKMLSQVYTKKSVRMASSIASVRVGLILIAT